MLFKFTGCNLPLGLAFPTVVLAGANSTSSVGGFGITRVPAEFAIKAFGPKGEYQDSAAFKNGCIFIADDFAAAVDMANERARVASGFDRLDPDKPAPGIEPTPETKAELAKTAALKTDAAKA